MLVGEPEIVSLVGPSRSIVGKEASAGYLVLLRDYSEGTNKIVCKKKDSNAEIRSLAERCKDHEDLVELLNRMGFEDETDFSAPALADLVVRNLNSLVHLFHNKQKPEDDSETPDPEAEYILDCPFCGSDEFEWHSFGEDKMGVRCDPCDAIGPSAGNKKEAISEWNRRHIKTTRTIQKEETR